MEEARSLVPRLVELAFVPERMAGEMLAQAFAWLTCVDDPRPEDPSSVQGRCVQEVYEVSTVQEVMP